MAEIFTMRYIMHEGERFCIGDAVMVGGTGRPIVEAVIDRIGEVRVWFLSGEGIFPLPADEIEYLKKCTDVPCQ